jgi:hypothetical protein
MHTERDSWNPHDHASPPSEMSLKEKTDAFVAAITPAQKRAWMAERRLVAEARAEMAAEVDAEIAAEEERKTRRRYCMTPHNTSYCADCRTIKIEQLSPAQNSNTGWYAPDRVNELHKQRC